MDFNYDQHMRFLQLYNAAVAAQELEDRSRLSRRLSRQNSFTYPSHDRIYYPPPTRRSESSGKLELRRRSRTSSESGYNSNRSQSLDRRMSKSSSIHSDTYEGYPKIRRVSSTRRDEKAGRPPSPTIIKRKSSTKSMGSTRGRDSPSSSVRFSTVEDIMSACDDGNGWSGRYAPRMSISSDRESYVSAHSLNDYDQIYRRRPSSASLARDYVDARRHSSKGHRRSSSSSRRDSVSSRRDSVSSRRASVSSRKASISSRRDSVSSRRSSVAGSRRGSVSSRRLSSYGPPYMAVVNSNGIEGNQIMRRLSQGGDLKEWERSLIMRRRSSTSSRRRSSVGQASSSDSGSSSDSDSCSDSDDDSSSSYDSSYDSYTSSSGSGSDSGSESDSDGDKATKSSRKSSNVAKTPAQQRPTNDVNANMINAPNGAATSHMNGAALYAGDGDAGYRYQRLDSDSSSSVCIIL